MFKIPNTLTVVWRAFAVLFALLIPRFASGHEGVTEHLHLTGGITVPTYGILSLLILLGVLAISTIVRPETESPYSGRRQLLGFAVLLCLFASPMAVLGHHVMDTDRAPLIGGFCLPVHGADHFLAMISVGLLAASKTQRRWAFPASFVGFMLIGMAMGFARLPLPHVETGIWVSVVAFGLILAVLAKMPNTITAVLIGGFGIFHGYACGAEVPHAWSPWMFGIGLVACTIALIGLGFLAGGTVWRFTGERGLQVSGALAALVMTGLLILPLISGS